MRPCRFATLLAVSLLLSLPLFAAAAQAPPPATYTGTEACAPCHEDQHANFVKYAKKAKSAAHIKVMAKKLPPEEVKECYACHTTGYGKPGGFESFEKTPHLADAGCEVCHGPGSAHIDSGGDTKLIARPKLEDCAVCHGSERVANFNYKPLLHGGAH